MNKVLGAIEGGGTSFVCAIGTDRNNLHTIEMPTENPMVTIPKILEFFESQPVRPQAIGIAMFGPMDTQQDSPTYGTIMTSPKLEWNGTNILAKIRETLDVPVAIDTDVNAAAIGEHMHGAARDYDDFMYITVGGGVGGGGMANGRIISGLLNPEVGHMAVPHDRADDAFEGVCPFHRDCLEGLTNAEALHKRWGVAPEKLPSSHKAWDLEAKYLAHGVVNIITVISPRRIILGGGIMKREGLIDSIRYNVKKILNGYIDVPEISEGIDGYIVLPENHGSSGVLGAIAMAKNLVS